jgi:hypothetical protein
MTGTVDVGAGGVGAGGVGAGGVGAGDGAGVGVETVDGDVAESTPCPAQPLTVIAKKQVRKAFRLIP